MYSSNSTDFICLNYVCFIRPFFRVFCSLRSNNLCCVYLSELYDSNAEVRVTNAKLTATNILVKWSYLFKYLCIYKQLKRKLDN